MEVYILTKQLLDRVSVSAWALIMLFATDLCFPLRVCLTKLAGSEEVKQACGWETWLHQHGAERWFTFQNPDSFPAKNRKLEHSLVLTPVLCCCVCIEIDRGDIELLWDHHDI